MEAQAEQKPYINQKGVILVNQVIKERDDLGNSVIYGGQGSRYRITSKKSLLATGSLCKIKLCKDIQGNDQDQNQNYYAIKRFNKLTLKKHKQYLRRADGMGMRIWTQLDAVRLEIEIMKKVSHQNCIQLKEVIEDVPEKDDEGHDISDDSLSEKIYMIMELARYKEIMTWNLNNYQFVPNSCLLQGKNEFITQKYILKILEDCLQGMEYLHREAGIVHRDIKPQNILLCESQGEIPFAAKLCDFGVSEKLLEPFDENDSMAKTAGTYHFFPPECCDPDVNEYSGRKADIWALGVTLYCLTFNELPFWDSDNCENEFSILEYILKEDVEIPKDVRQIVADTELLKTLENDSQAISNSLIDLMLQMLCKDPEKRISIQGIKDHLLKFNQ